MKTYFFLRQPPPVALMGIVGGFITTMNLACAQPLQLEVLVSCNATNGAYPLAPLTQGSDGNFYGTASAQQFLDPTALAQPHQFYRVRQQ